MQDAFLPDGISYALKKYIGRLRATPDPGYLESFSAGTEIDGILSHYF